MILFQFYFSVNWKLLKLMASHVISTLRNGTTPASREQWRHVDCSLMSSAHRWLLSHCHERFVCRRSVIQTKLLVPFNFFFFFISVSMFNHNNSLLSLNVSKFLYAFHCVVSSILIRKFVTFTIVLSQLETFFKSLSKCSVTRDIYKSTQACCFASKSNR